MAKQYDVFILTINGKGYRVARDLAIGGRRVAWVDISELTHYQAKDLAGPFCAAVPADASDLYRREFLQDADLSPLPRGFTLWHQQGILEGTGEIAQYQAAQLQQPAAVAALQELSTTNNREKCQFIEEKFANNWLLFLATYVDKAQLEMSFTDLKESGTVSPIFAEAYLPEQDYSLRRKRAEELKVLGVDILPVADLQFRFEGEFYHFHLKDQGLVKAESFISFLTAWDLRQLDATFYQQVYQGEPLKSSHHWQRFMVSMESSVRSEQVPAWLVCVDNWDLPWLETNLYVLRRHRQDEEWSLWARVDSEKFIEPRYRQWLESQLSQKLNRRFVSDQVKVAVPAECDPKSMPHSVTAYPIYKNLRGRPQVIGRRFYSCGPDALGGFNAFELYRQQKKIQQDIIAGDLV